MNETATTAAPAAQPANPWAWWSAEAIASASECPLANVQANWPKLYEQLGHCKIQTPNVAIGIIGTTAIEGASTFEPVQEGCYLGEPEPAQSHRNGLSYAPYWGRGHIQLTHAGNYQTYGPKVAVLWGASPSDPTFDLFNHPDNALDPDIAAAVMALYFRDTRALPTASYPEGYTLIQACEEQDWDWVRRLVYGGPDPAGTERITRIAEQLGPPGGQVAPPVMPPVVLPAYDAAEPAISQNDSWSCAPTSTRWALWAYGRTPSEQWIESAMIQEGVVSPSLGLLDASGAGLAAFLNRHYGEHGYASSHDPTLTWQELVAEGTEGKHPLMLGGRGWYHWTGCRGFDEATGQARLANPAPGYQGVGQTLSKAQFDALGPFSLVRLTHPAAEAEGGGGQPQPPDPGYAPPGSVGSGILSMMAADNTQPAMPSTFLPLGASPAVAEQCWGLNGTQYVWHLPTGRAWRYPAA